MLAVRVQMLDDTVSMFQVQSKAVGRVLFDQVCKQLNLLEADYFGLEYQDVNGIKYWVDTEKPLCRQLGLSMLEPSLRFCVKFYTPDPARLEEEFTRYLFCLQIKRDLAQGVLQCNENTAALMASYIVQAECGDYVPEEYGTTNYLGGYRFYPNQDQLAANRICDNHRKHNGQSPAEADLNLLETARRCELYGMRMHVAKDLEGAPLNLSVAHMGIVVFQNVTKINTFSWAKIRKISFKRKKFLIKLHPETYGYSREVVEFVFPCRNSCKNFWKKCVEHHGFYRCVRPPPPPSGTLLHRGSSFRYSGRTQKQIVEYVRDNYVKRQTFQRWRSGRSGRSDSERPLATSLSAHPLLPLPPGSQAISLEWECQTFPEWAVRSKPTTRPHTLGTCQKLRDQRACPEVVTRAEVNRPPTPESPDLPTRTLSTYAAAAPTWSEQDAKEQGTPTPAEDDTVSSASILVSRQDVIDGQTDTTIRPDGQNTDTTISPDGQGTDTTISSDGQRTDKTVVEENGNDEGLISPDSTSVSLSLPRALPLSTSTPLHCDLQDKPHTKGQDKSHSLKEKTQSLREVNGNTDTSTVAESLTSIDVLSGGESDAGDTISKNKWNNSISRGLSTVPRPRDQLDPGYYVAKELLMTERTYKADLETLTVGWSTSVWSLPERSEAARPCLAVEEVVLSHGGLLARLDRALSDRDSEEPEYRKVPELLHEHLKSTYDLYLRYISECGSVVGRLEATRRKDPHVGRAAVLHDLTHHIPLHAAVLRPLHRMDYYMQYAQHLQSSFPTQWSKRVQSLLRALSESAVQQLEHTQNHVTLCQLQRDLLGYGKLLVAGREFLRLGCAYKHSNKGMQQRMLFLFSDILVICSKSSTGSQFRATCVLPVKHIQVQSSQLPHTFILVYGDTSTMFSCSNEEDYLRWRQELTDAKDNAPQHEPDLTLDDTSHDADVDETAVSSSVTAVCWHRGTSVSREHLHLATTSQLSGYLLRKFKNSYGWQKLWVVFCMFTLYFYKSWHEQKPLASLPLLGYKVCVPSEADGIKKEFVFKLQFKNHVYFFRADSQYTFNRWVETLQIASLQDHHNNNEQN